MPGGSPRPLHLLGLEKNDAERQRRKGPWKPEQPGPRWGEPRPRSRESGQPWESRSTGRPRQAGETAPVVSTPIGNAYEEAVGALAAIYPGARRWTTKEGMWLLVQSRLLAGIRQHALFLVGVSLAGAFVRSWAFWADPIARPVWIGPRHTNFTDGSICAFEPSDGTWVFGDPLVELLDIYSVWALRHLHLEMVGRWPGPQAVHRPYERLLEIRPDEQCGCGSPGQTYALCCQPRDLARDRIADAVEFAIWCRWTLRQPPEAVVDFVRNPHEVGYLDGLL
jgi:hypothetical protein